MVCGAAAGAWPFTPRASGARRPWRRIEPRRRPSPRRARSRRPRLRRADLRRLVPVRPDGRAAADQAQAGLPPGADGPSGLADHVFLRRPQAPAQRGRLRRARRCAAEIARLGGGTVESYPEDSEGRSVFGVVPPQRRAVDVREARVQRTRRLGKHHWVVARVVARERSTSLGDSVATTRREVR